MASKLLSKSRYLAGLQCPMYLWLLCHEPGKIPQPDAATQHAFDQGHLVGELAKKQFPNGIGIPADNFVDNIKETRRLLQLRRPLFEAGILVENIFARADILNPVDEDGWDIIEVKSSTGVRPVHIHDASFQRFCYQQAGLQIRKCFLMHINNKYVKDGEIAPAQLFSTVDITEDVQEVSIGILDRIESMFELLATKQSPDIAIGRHCNEPYDCPLQEWCWDFLPANNVFNLYGGRQKGFDLLADGVQVIKDIPDDFKLTHRQQIQIDSLLSGQPHIDRGKIKDFLSQLRFPLHYLDFETFSPVVPIFNGTRPHQIIPFQFSLHMVAEEASAPKHFSFLAEDSEDPRPEFLSQLRRVLGNNGSIVVYNQDFEKGVLRELGEAFPEYGQWVEEISARMIDLYSPFRNFYYYHPLQNGSTSLKKVLPALTGKDYQDLDINNGQVASIAFQHAAYDNVPEELRSQVRGALEKYCALDTAGMIWIVDRLKEIVETKSGGDRGSQLSFEFQD